MIVESRCTSGAHRVTCNTWDEFVMAARSARSTAHGPSVTRLFRGHAKSDWPLASVWERFLIDKRERGEPLTGTEGDVLRRRLEYFKDHATGLPGVVRANLQSEWEWWALGRHHGLVTPLLDWSKSSFVAAFFAWTDYWRIMNPGIAAWSGPYTYVGGGPVAVWEFASSKDLERDGEFVTFTARGDHAYRQKAQRGVFTMLQHAELFDLESYLASRGLAERLTKYEIDDGAVGPALAELSAMNVRYGTLFPDLDGAALQANFDDREGLFIELVGMLSLRARQERDATVWVKLRLLRELAVVAGNNVRVLRRGDTCNLPVAAASSLISAGGAERVDVEESGQDA
jgi:hypothetical protein